MPVVYVLALSAAISWVIASANAQESNKELTYSADVSEVQIKSSADSQFQKALWFAPDSNSPRPLLVALHTWSSDFSQAGGEVLYASWCLQENWIFIHPDFRGRNRSPQACGSDLVVSDVLDAVAFAKANANVDADRIYLVGVSGGGHASMLLAARAPEVWAGVSAWCGISDLATWHEQCKGTAQDRYAREMEAACGGSPQDPFARKQFLNRSPLTWMKKQTLNVNLDLNHGVSDGRTGSVPFTHSLHAFNAVAAAEDQFTAQEIHRFYESQEPPEAQDIPNLPHWGNRQPIFRRTSANTRVTIFQGGHEIVHQAALNWLALQRKGQQAVWELDPAQVRQLKDAELGGESGK